MANVGDLRTKISLDSAEFQRSMASVNRELRGLKHEQRAVTSTGTGFARGVDELRGKADVLNRTLDLQKQQVTELKRRYEESKKETGENSAETERANIAYQKAVAEMNKTEHALKGVTSELERQTNPWNQLGDRLDNTGQKLQTIGRGMTDFGRGMTTRVTLPMVGLGAAALKVGMDFEQGMSQVQALTNGTSEEMAAMSEQAKFLGETTRFSATQAAEGMAFLGMAGWETQEILDGMPGLLNLAASANMELGRAADITSNIMAAFNIEAAEAGRVSDVLAHAASNSNTNVEQLGEAMKYVAPTANTLGLSIEDTAAAIMAVSDAGIQGSQAGRAFGTSLLRLSDPTAAMQKEMDKLNVSFFDSEGVMKGLPDIIQELETSMADYDSEQRAAALSTIFGTEAQRHWAIMLDTGSDALRNNSNELENSEGAAERMAATMSDNAKGAIVEFRSALEGIGIAISEHMIPMFTDAVRWGTDLVRKFGELDEETQKNILQMGLFAAATGPVIWGLGQVTTGVGGMLRIGGDLSRLLGRAGGSGLLGRLALMGPGAATPVGLAIAGAAALAGGIYYLVSEKNKLHDVSTEVAEGLWDEADALEELVVEFEKLRSNAALSNDEFGRMIDIQKELETTQDPSRIERLQTEYEKLQEKSGLSNDELEKMFGLNDDIVKQSPEVEKSFTDKGNAVITATDAVKDYIQSLRDMAMHELQEEKLKALDNEVKLRQQIEDDTRKLADVESEIRDIRELANQHTYQNLQDYEYIRDRLQEIDLLLLDHTLTESEYNALLDEQLALMTVQREGITGALEGLQEKRDQLIENVELNEAELTKLDEIHAKMAELLLAEVDINFEKGEGLNKLDERIDKLRDERQELWDNATEEEKRSGILDDQLNNLDEQITNHEHIRDKIIEETGYQSEANRLQEEQNRQLELAMAEFQAMAPAQQSTNREIEIGRGYAEGLTRELAKDVTKEVDVDDNGTAKEITDEAGKSVTKSVTLSAAWTGVRAGLRAALGNFSFPGFAKGTDYHPGGLSWVGEEGFELARHGNNWSLLDFGLMDIPRGTEIFTHGESKRILRAINNIPGYAGGVSSPGESNRMINRLNNQQSSQPIVIELHVTSEIDGRVAGQAVERYVTEIQERNKVVKDRFAKINDF